LRPFEFVTAHSAEDAVAALAQHGPDAKPIAGCTDLLVDIKHETAAAKVLVDISRIPEIRGIEMTGAGLRIGAATTHTEIMEHPLIQKHAPALIDAAHTVGAVQTRNLGTLAGNLVTCVPSMDSGPALMALEAYVNVLGVKGMRKLTLEELFVGPRKTALKPDEILLDIVIPKENVGKSAAFLKFGLRKGQALALVNAAVALNVAGGKITEPRIALGAVAPVVMRAKKAEAALEGKKTDDTAAIEKAAAIAVTEAKPIDDFRASAEYRRHLIRVLTRRCIEAALAGAAGKK